MSCAEANGRAAVVIRHPACPGGKVDEAMHWLGRFEHRGDDVITEVRGEAVVVLWNGRAGRLLAMRPPGTTRRLFYAANDDGLLLADDLRRLSERLRSDVGLNRAALASIVAERWYGAHETCLETVSRVPPAHALVWEAGDVTLRQFWDPLPAGQPVEWIAEGVAERFDQLLEEAVERAVGSQRPAIFLSGGLDSVSVAAAASTMAARERRPTPLALSLAMSDPGCDERATQESVAARLGLDQIMLDFDDAIGDTGFLGAALELAADWPEPLQNFWLPAYMRMARIARERGCRIILTGGGGDEWLAVTPLLASDYLRRMRLGSWWRLVQTLSRSYEFSRPRLMYNLGWRFGLRPVAVEGALRAIGSVSKELVSSVLRYRRRLPAWLAPDPVLRRILDEREAELVERRMAMPREDEYVRECRRAVAHPLVAIEQDELAEEGGRTNTLRRQPFFDPDLAEFLARVRPDLLCSGGRSKGLVRDRVAALCPGLGFEDQRKVVGTGLVVNRMRIEIGRVWDRLGGPRVLGGLGVVDPRRLGHLSQSLATGQADARALFRGWTILSTEAWVRRQTGMG
jgi:asparagine synthetase B (glutamine-hydrolysing)